MFWLSFSIYIFILNIFVALITHVRRFTQARITQIFLFCVFIKMLQKHASCGITHARQLMILAVRVLWRRMEGSYRRSVLVKAFELIVRKIIVRAEVQSVRLCIRNSVVGGPQSFLATDTIFCIVQILLDCASFY